jgi:hypothetical protein
MKTFRVLVEDKYGLMAVHLVDAYFAETAKASEESLGYRVLFVSE